MNSKVDLLSILSRDPELFNNIEGEEIDAPQRLNWEALDHQIFIIHQVNGDMNGYILVLSSDEQDEIYEKLDKVVDASTAIVERFLKNFANELDLNLLLEPPKVCPATQNFSVDPSFGHHVIDFQKKKRFLSILKNYVENPHAVQLERAFKFQIKDLNLKFYFCLSASDIRNVQQ